MQQRLGTIKLNLHAYRCMYLQMLSKTTVHEQVSHNMAQNEPYIVQICYFYSVHVR